MGLWSSKALAPGDKDKKRPSSVDIYIDNNGDDDDDDLVDLPPPPPGPLTRFRRSCIEEIPAMLDVGRLSPVAVRLMLPERDGPGTGVIFAVLAAAHVARKKQRLTSAVPVGGFSVWAMEKALKDDDSSRRCRHLQASLGSTSLLLDVYGISATYSDREGVAEPTLEHLIEADDYPSVHGLCLPAEASAVLDALRGGDAVACTWHHAGDSRAELSDGTVVRRLLFGRPDGIKGQQDVAAGCIVGYDPAPDLFFGHSPAVAGEGTLVAFGSDFLCVNCLDLIRVKLNEDPTTLDDDCGSTVDSYTPPPESSPVSPLRSEDTWVDQVE